MSKDIYNDDDFSLTQFYGGEENGISIQITTEMLKYAQLNRKAVSRLVKELNKWLEDTEPEGFIHEL